MKIELKQQFLELWKKYFGDAELPITFFYTTGDAGAERAEKPKDRSCLICGYLICTALCSGRYSHIFSPDEKI